MTRPTHLPTRMLDAYLHHTLPPNDHQQIRAHLDNCGPCWQAWNRHRWDAARPSPLFAQLAEFLGAEFRPYFDSSRALAAEWDAVDPRTDHNIAQFFRTSTSYLYNLAIWEASGNRTDYLAHALPTLARHGTRTVLNYGCGIGSDTLSLHHGGFDVVGCDFRSPSTAFLRWRSAGAIPVIEPGDLWSLNEPDTLWVIDTLDHLTNIETSLGALLSVVDLVVTENLTINRGHGRQRFHHRRPFPELTALFARHGLIPSVAAAGTPIMFWTRHHWTCTDDDAHRGSSSLRGRRRSLMRTSELSAPRSVLGTPPLRASRNTRSLEAQRQRHEPVTQPSVTTIDRFALARQVSW